MAQEVQDNVSYEMLQDLLRAERRSNKLMAVPARFWPMVREFLELVTQAFRIEQAKDPFSRKVMMLSDQVKNALHASQSLWALRERKLAMLALAATKERKMPDGITPDEGALYHDLVGVLEESRNRVFDGTVAAPSLEPPALPVPTAAPAPTSAPPVQMPVFERQQPAAVTAAPVNVPHDTRSAPPEMTTIRALSDLPPFVGPDMQTYTLKAGDIATVPPSIANLLVRRNKAAVVESV
ncbi:MAG: replication factor [Thermoplasmata archaeon]|nr:replication factor [Thermoplasmata archaeon]MEA3166683.1 replication factor [Thermoplasmata archaeon]